MRSNPPQAFMRWLLVISGMVIRGKSYKNVGIGRADWSRVAVREIDAAVGQTYVVNNVVDFPCRNLLSNRLFDLVAEVGGFFDAHSGGRTQMKLERTAVNAGKEVAAQPGKQNRERAQAGREERDQESTPMMEANLQQAAIAVTKPFEGRLKAFLKPYKRIAAGGISFLLFSPQ